MNLAGSGAGPPAWQRAELAVQDRCHTSGMQAQGFDDGAIQAMAEFVRAAQRLDEAAEVGGEARDLLDLAEAKTVAALQVRKRLTEAGWSAPTQARSSA